MDAASFSLNLMTLDQDTVTFLASHDRTRGPIDLVESVQAIQGICTRIAQAEKCWRGSEALDRSAIVKLQNDVTKLEAWVAENGVDSIEIRVLLKTSATALATLLPWQSVRQKYRLCHQVLFSDRALLDRIAREAKIDPHLIHYTTAMRMTRILLEIPNSERAKHLSLEQREFLLRKIEQDLIPLVQSQITYFQTLMVQMNAKLQTLQTHVDVARRRLVQNSTADTDSLMQDYRAFQQGVIALRNFADDYYDLGRAVEKIGNVLRITVTDPRLLPYYNELCRNVKEQRSQVSLGLMATSISGADIARCHEHLLARLKVSDPSGNGFVSNMSNRLVAYGRNPAPSQAESQVDLECVSALWAIHANQWKLPSRAYASLGELQTRAHAILAGSTMDDDFVDQAMMNAEIREIQTGEFNSRVLTSYKFSPKQKEILLLEAVRARNSNAVDILLTQGTDYEGNGLPEGQIGPSIFWKALEQGSDTIIHIFQSHGADINMLYQDGWNAAIHAIAANQLERADMFFSLGAKTDVVGEQGASPLMIAAFHGNRPAIELLIRHGAKIDFSGDPGNSVPLLMAIKNNQREAMNALLQAGALGVAKDHRTWIQLVEHQASYPMNSLVSEIGRHSICREFVGAKLLGHSLKFKGVVPFQGGLVDLEHFNSPYFSNEMLESFRAFVTENPGRLRKREIVSLKAMLRAGTLGRTTSAATRLAEIHKSVVPVPIDSGFSKHNVQVVFLGDYLIINNKGAASYRPAEVYELTKKKQITESQIEEISGLKELPREKYVEWKTWLPATLGVNSNDFTRFIERIYPLHPHQLIGNCAWESVETSVFFTLAVGRFSKNFDPQNPPSAAAIKEVQDTFVDWMRFTQLYSVEKYFNQVDREEIPFNQQLATMAFQQIWSIYPWPESMGARVSELENRFMNKLNVTDRQIVKAKKTFVTALQLRTRVMGYFRPRRIESLFS